MVEILKKAKTFYLENKIGMRNIKTALSVMICYLITIAKDINPFFACTAAVVSMQSSIDDSVRAAAKRMIGTVFGAIVGVIVYYLDVKYLSSVHLSFLSIGLGVVMLIFIMNIFKHTGAIVTASIVMFAIMFRVDDHVIVYSVTRVLETFLGIAVALVVNKAIAPPKEY